MQVRNSTPRAHFSGAFGHAAALALLAGAMLCRLHGAPPNSTVTGKVLDPSRAPVAGVSVAATTDSGTTVAVTRSDSAGGFSVSLPPGSYTLRISSDGFQETSRAVTVSGSALPALEIVLPLAARAEVITVTEAANYQVMTSSSTKTPTPLLDVPQSISVVTRDLIRDQGMLNMADVVRYVPGITMAQGEGHRDAPVIRGNATTADFYVNGVRDDVQYYRDLYNVERVEAVKGANALTFGRGGGGGVINRVTKDAVFQPVRELALHGGTFNNKRIAADFGQNLGDRLAFRINSVYENSDSFRHDVNLERYGVAPTLTLKAADSTTLRFAYEYFNDGRIVDRGIPSFQGRPSHAHRSTYFGDPEQSPASAGVNLGSATLERQLGTFNLRNHTLIGDYDKFYQNLVPGAVNATETLVSLSGYSNATLRRNIFNQTDLSGVAFTGRFRHTLLIGTEFGRQRSDNFRNTAYFNNTATSVNLPFLNPRYTGPVAFRQSATDADNFATNHIASVYVQDQVELTRRLQVVAGVRYDRFTIDFHNRRTSENLARLDNMVSPRAGIVIKPAAALSLYTSYSVSYLPSSGDQFSSLTATSQTLKPEKFANYEVGAKWDVGRAVALTTAVYRLDRTNTTARDPNNPAITVQTGSQRTNGYELGVNGSLTGRWHIVGGYAYQDAFITSATMAAAPGAKAALVPHHTVSLWNNYRLLRRLNMGLGVIHQAEMYAGIDNTVWLPQFTRADLAAYYTLTETVRLQANVENLFDRTYYATAHSNNNIMPGYARAVRLALVARF
jgi:catecholate siderophore receptor